MDNITIEQKQDKKTSLTKGQLLRLMVYVTNDQQMLSRVICSSKPR